VSTPEGVPTCWTLEDRGFLLGALVLTDTQEFFLGDDPLTHALHGVQVLGVRDALLAHATEFGVIGNPSLSQTTELVRVRDPQLSEPVAADSSGRALPELRENMRSNDEVLDGLTEGVERAVLGDVPASEDPSEFPHQDARQQPGSELRKDVLGVLLQEAIHEAFLNRSEHEGRQGHAAQGLKTRGGAQVLQRAEDRHRPSHFRFAEARGVVGQAAEAGRVSPASRLPTTALTRAPTTATTSGPDLPTTAPTTTLTTACPTDPSPTTALTTACPTDPTTTATTLGGPCLPATATLATGAQTRDGLKRDGIGELAEGAAHSLDAMPDLAATTPTATTETPVGPTSGPADLALLAAPATTTAACPTEATTRTTDALLGSLDPTTTATTISLRPSGRLGDALHVGPTSSLPTATLAGATPTTLPSDLHHRLPTTATTLLATGPTHATNPATAPLSATATPCAAQTDVPEAVDEIDALIDSVESTLVVVLLFAQHLLGLELFVLEIQIDVRILERVLQVGKHVQLRKETNRNLRVRRTPFRAGTAP
jgi:hypothetical protein